MIKFDESSFYCTEVDEKYFKTTSFYKVTLNQLCFLLENDNHTELIMLG